MIRRLLSFFLPVNIYSRNSKISRSLEVTWNNGQLVLDSKNTNYSYGSLQRILRKGLFSISAERINAMRHILVLGVAGGSVIKTLSDEIGFKGKITGVEIDPDVIAIANVYFNLDKISGLSVVIDDAFEFVLKTKVHYEMIIVDIFCDTTMPQFLFEMFFVERLHEILTSGGYILFNTMTLTEAQNKRNLQYISEIDPLKFSVKTIPRVEQHNELIILQKLV